MNFNSFDSRRTAFADGFKVAAATIVVGVVAVSGASNDAVSTVTLHDVAASAAAASATHYVPSGYVLDATGATPHIEAF